MTSEGEGGKYGVEIEFSKAREQESHGDGDYQQGTRCRVSPFLYKGMTDHCQRIKRLQPRTLARGELDRTPHNDSSNERDVWERGR